MLYRNITLEEFARHIGMDAREVQRLADRGTFPGQRVGNEWRFNRAQMLDWLQREMHSLGDKHLLNLERATCEEPDIALLDGLLTVDAIDLNLHAKSKPSVLRELTALAERTGLVYDSAELATALAERETRGSTALPGGLALPHPHQPLPYATAQPLVCLARVPAGVPFGAPDGKLTYLFVLICSHEERQHLHTLARIALLFNHPGLLAALRETDDSAEALALIAKTEKQLLTQRR